MSNLDNALKLLEAAPYKRKGATDSQIRAAAKKLRRPIPLAWQQVMKIADGGAIFTHAKECEEFDMSKAKDFAKNNKFARDFVEQGWPKFPKHYLAVVANEFQDFIFLDTSKVNRDGDCPVVFIDHEECRVQKKWPSIAKLLEYVLTAKPRKKKA